MNTLNTPLTSIDDINALPINIRYIGEVPSPWDKTKKRLAVDQWIVAMRHGNKIETFDYYTGLGLRAKPKLSWLNNRNPPKHGTLAWEQLEKTRKPVKPKNSDILYSLVLDFEAINTSFYDWCDNFGYDNDSISSLNTYNACCESAKKLLLIFTRKQIDSIRELLQDY